MKNESIERKRKHTKLDVERMLNDAVDSGVSSGRLLGLVEAYEFLVKSGFKQSAKTLKSYIEESSPSRLKAEA